LIRASQCIGLANISLDLVVGQPPFLESHRMPANP